MKNSTRSAGYAGFSLVEVTIAIGLFAFVLVGILGLYPAALRQRADAALELRSTLIAQQVFEGIRAANAVTNAVGSDYSIKWDDAGSKTAPTLADYVAGEVFGFSQDGTTVNHIFDNTNYWANTDVGPPEQSISTKALVVASNVSPGLYAVTLQVGYPANLPADKRRLQTFQKLVYAQ
jgi:uncharacterized protein (TIGR02598 family)